eukprot:scaffold3777_cov335-Prasinococcus_capsulatus_cf.AAC.6
MGLPAGGDTDSRPSWPPAIHSSVQPSSRPSTCRRNSTPRHAAPRHAAPVLIPRPARPLAAPSAPPREMGCAALRCDAMGWARDGCG